MKARTPAGGSYDVVILGGGPAGSATALAIKRRDAKLRVALVEKTDYSTVRVGETLPPPAQRLLTDLGVWEAFLRRDPLEASGTRAAWGNARFHENEFIYSPYGRGWHVDRRDFDALLAREAGRAGVDLYRRAMIQAQERCDDEWLLTLQQADAPLRAVCARFVVDATGRRSSFARARGARHLVFDQLVGIAVLLQVDPESPPLDTYASVEACRHGWWYSAMLPNGKLAVIFMTDASQLRSLPWRTFKQWSALAALAPYTAGCIAGARALREPCVYPASSQRLDACVGGGWLAAGDAASAYDPLSSQGIMKALRSGITASRAICADLAGHSQALAVYSAALAKEYEHYLERRAAYYAMERRWPESPFWRSRHQHQTHDQGGTAHGFDVENQHQDEPETAGARDI